MAATWRGNRRLFADPVIRTVLIMQWVPNGLVGAEVLAVPYAGDQAGLLFTAAAIGMMGGDFVVGRFVPADRRVRLVVPLYLLLAVPYLAFQPAGLRRNSNLDHVCGSVPAEPGHDAFGHGDGLAVVGWVAASWVAGGESDHVVGPCGLTFRRKRPCRRSSHPLCVCAGGRPF